MVAARMAAERKSMVAVWFDDYFDLIIMKVKEGVLGGGWRRNRPPTPMTPKSLNFASKSQFRTCVGININ